MQGAKAAKFEARRADSWSRILGEGQQAALR